MGNDTLSTASDSTKLDQLAADIQVQARRIRSLADALDDAIDFGVENKEQRGRLGRAADFVGLILEAAEKIEAAGEWAEIHNLRSRLAAE